MSSEQIGGLSAWRRRMARSYKHYRVRRARKKHAGKRGTVSRRSSIVLGLILVVLFGAFAWSQTYLEPESPGQELTFDEIDALAKEKRIASAEFRDEDAQLVGSYQAEPLPGFEKEEPKPRDEKPEAKDDAESGEDADGENAGTPDESEGESGATGPNAGDANNDANAGGDEDGGDAKKAAGKPEPEPQPKAPEGDGEFWVQLPQNGAAFGPLVDALTAAGASVSVDPQTSKAVVRVISQFLLPLLILAAFFGLLFTAGRGGGSGIGDVMQFGSIGKGKTKKGASGMVTYKDVGGAEEAVLELSEVVDYLQNPERYEEIGAVPPKGV
ncbi:MAG: hypothetical protein ABR613_04500, partial [Actinomycetota bacterium]